MLRGGWRSENLGGGGQFCKNFRQFRPLPPNFFKKKCCWDKNSLFFRCWVLWLSWMQSPLDGHCHHTDSYVYDFYYHLLIQLARVAQLVERQAFNLNVQGSSPCSGDIFFTHTYFNGHKLNKAHIEYTSFIRESFCELATSGRPFRLTDNFSYWHEMDSFHDVQTKVSEIVTR